MADKIDDDERLALRLSKLDPEKFVTLCRMHLSFILDLDSESLERIGDINTQLNKKIKKSFAPVLPKRPRMLGFRDEDPVNIKQSKDGQAIYELMNFLGLETNLTQEGLFRKSGKMSRQEELFQLIKTGNSLSLQSGVYSAHDCAGVLKRFLSELPEPLLTEQHYHVHCQITGLCQSSFVGEQKNSATRRQIEAIQLLIWLLPSKSRRMLKTLLELLHQVATKHPGNKMDAVNLATIFAPHILCPRKMSAEELCNNSGNMIKAVSLMIEKAPELFKVPEGLSRDLKVLWNSKVDSKSIRSKSNLPVAATSGRFEEEAITTVTTFCQRQPVGHENTDTTAVALAQLYAHVQALPESSKKKHLIKQFNKENGNGTPLCNERQRNHHRSRSLKKSIKKHLFGGHKRHRSSEYQTEIPYKNCEENGIVLKVKSNQEVCQLTNIKSYECGEGSKTGLERTRQTTVANTGNCKCEPTREQEDNSIGCSFCRLTTQRLSVSIHNEERPCPQMSPPQANLISYRSILNQNMSQVSSLSLKSQISSSQLLRGYNYYTRETHIYKETSL